MNNPFFLLCFRAFKLLHHQVIIIFAMNFSQVSFSFFMLTAMTTSLNLVAVLLMKGESVNWAENMAPVEVM
jgi:hypothetical protein